MDRRHAAPGDDAENVSFFDIDKIPHLAFDSNTRAIKAYIRDKQDYWDMMDSFALSIGEVPTGKTGRSFLSDKLVRIVENNADIIAGRWLEDVRTGKSTPAYASADPERTLQRSLMIISQFRKWLGGEYTDLHVRNFYYGDSSRFLLLH